MVCFFLFRACFFGKISEGVGNFEFESPESDDAESLCKRKKG